ncbi:MAG TPA: formate/nitrite transporter family protein [Acidimicrobiales bacterium]|nr:formate/nitrite transporter family protein [Acidimicrobiales bacterium]
MPYKTPAEVASAAVASGVAKASLGPGKLFVSSFLAGAYIAFGGLVAIATTSGLKPATWGSLPTLVTGATFSLGLILVVIAGSDLLTGNMAVVTIAVLRRKVSPASWAANLGWVMVGNLVGALLVAWLLAYKTGVIPDHHAGGIVYERIAAIAKGKAVTETHLQQFLRAIGCNWLVCLAVWLGLAAEDIAGKILGIFFPILAFVAIGFDHVVANMFFLPLAMFDHVPGITGSLVAANLGWALLGNLVGAAVFVAGAYHYLYLQGQPDQLAANVPVEGEALDRPARAPRPGRSRRP